MANKVEAVLEAFNLYFDDVIIESVNISSGVSDMPYCVEVERGVKHRLNNLKVYANTEHINADYLVAIESGLYNYFGSWMMTSLVAVSDMTNKVSYATSGSYPIPSNYVNDIMTKGLEYVLRDIFKKEASGHTTGGVGYLTKGKLVRKDLMKEAIILALTRFINDNW